MKRRSFIATLAAGIAGLFVPLPKPVPCCAGQDHCRHYWTGTGEHLVHSDLEFMEVSLVDLGPNYWDGTNWDNDSRYYFATTGELKT